MEWTPFCDRLTLLVMVLIFQVLEAFHYRGGNQIKKIPNSKRFQNCEICGLGSLGNSKIFNGTSITREKYPWVVLITMNETEEGFVNSCTGSIISSKFILTAGHCAMKSESKKCTQNGVIRENCLRRPYDMLMHTELSINANNHEALITHGFKIKTFVLHEKYKQTDTHTDNDIALIELMNPITCDETLAPICIPFYELVPSKKVIIAGYGKDTLENHPAHDDIVKLKEGRVEQINSEHCTIGKQRFPEMYFCNTGVNTYQRSCVGDSGSGLFSKFRDGYYVLGITSTGSSPKCDHSGINYDMNVYYYSRFISANVENLPVPQGYNNKRHKNFYGQLKKHSRNTKQQKETKCNYSRNRMQQKRNGNQQYGYTRPTFKCSG